MKVKELIEILKKVDGELPVATHALESNYFSDKHADGKIEKLDVKVSLVHHWSGLHLMIGDQKNKNIKGLKCHIIKDIHGETKNDFKIKKCTLKEKRKPAKVGIYRSKSEDGFPQIFVEAFEVQVDQVENARKQAKFFGLKVERINDVMYFSGEIWRDAAIDGYYIIQLPNDNILILDKETFKEKFEDITENKRT